MRKEGSVDEVLMEFGGLGEVNSDGTAVEIVNSRYSGDYVENLHSGTLAFREPRMIDDYQAAGVKL